MHNVLELDCLKKIKVININSERIKNVYLRCLFFSFKINFCSIRRVALIIFWGTDWLTTIVIFLGFLLMLFLLMMSVVMFVFMMSMGMFVVNMFVFMFMMLLGLLLLAGLTWTVWFFINITTIKSTLLQIKIKFLILNSYNSLTLRCGNGAGFTA